MSAVRRTPAADDRNERELKERYHILALLRDPACFAARDPPEHRAGHQAGAAWIIEIEQAADQFACSVESGNRRILDVKHVAGCVDLQAPEGKRDAATDGVGFERRLLQGVRPVRLV